MKKFYFLLIVIIALSCQNNKKNAELSLNRSCLLNLQVNEDKFIIPNQLENTRYLTLESNEKNKISSVDKLQIFNNHLFIFDEQQNKIFIFDDNGHFTEQIDNKGKGPDEYLYLSDFLINKQDSCLELLDVGNKKILRLDRSYKMKGEIKLHFFCEKFLKCNPGGYLFFTNNQSNSGGQGGKSYNFIQIDQDGKEVTRFLPILPERQDLIIAEPYCFTSYRNGAVFSLPIDNKIYHIINDSIAVGYSVSFGKLNTPDKILASLKNVTSQNKIQHQMKIFNDIAKNGYAYSIHSVLENEIFLFFQFRKKKDLYSVLYNKKNKQIITGRNVIDIDNSLILGQPVAINDKNELVTVLFPYELLDNQKQNTISGKTENNKLVKLLATINQFDNPIIKFVKLPTLMKNN
jgi:hypothetical protein